MNRCPCCTARLGGAAHCPRCQADLSKTISAEQSAQFWLTKAIQYWEESRVEQSLCALDLSFRLKKTKLALVFRDFLIHQQCIRVLDLLAQKHLLSATQRLYKVRLLLPHSQQLRKLNSFTAYLLAKTHDQYQTQSLSCKFINFTGGKSSA